MGRCSGKVTERRTGLEGTSGWQGELEDWVCDGMVLMADRPWEEEEKEELFRDDLDVWIVSVRHVIRHVFPFFPVVSSSAIQNNQKIIVDIFFFVFKVWTYITSVHNILKVFEEIVCYNFFKRVKFEFRKTSKYNR